MRDFFNGYTDFSDDSFESEDYLKLCNTILEHARDEKTYRLAYEVLRNGGFEDYSVNEYSEFMNRNNPHIEIKKRAGMAWLITSYKKTFDYIRKEKIGFFHGTNSAALPEILTKGLNSLNKITRDGGKISSGEEWSMQYRLNNNSDNFVSITDDINTAGDYSTLSPKGEAKNQPYFGVLIGINKEIFDKLKKRTIHSDVVEVGIVDGIPPELISFIGVPADKVDMVQKMVTNPNIKVMPVDFKERYFFIDETGIIFINEEKSNQLLAGERQKEKTFGIDAFKKLAKTRTIGKLLESMRSLREATRKKKHSKESFDQEI